MACCRFRGHEDKIVTERGVTVAHACWDLELVESVLRRWMRVATAAQASAFPGNGQQRADLAEVAALKKEVAKFKAERDIQKMARPSSRGKRHDVRVRCEASARLACQLDVQRAGRLPVGLPCLAQATDQRPGALRREAPRGDRQELQSQRSHLWRAPGLGDVLENGRACGLHRIERLMRQNAIRARPKRQRQSQGRWRTFGGRRQHPRPRSLGRPPEPELAGRFHLHLDGRGLALRLGRAGPVLTTRPRWIAPLQSPARTCTDVHAARLAADVERQPPCPGGQGG